MGSNPTGTAITKSPENPVFTGIPGLFPLPTGRSGNAAVTGTQLGVVSNRSLPGRRAVMDPCSGPLVVSGAVGSKPWKGAEGPRPSPPSTRRHR